jgi:hypothetical protein
VILDIQIYQIDLDLLMSIYHSFFRVVHSRRSSHYGIVIIYEYNFSKTRNVLRCTQIKVKVKFLIFDFHTPFDREFQGGQEYVCLEVFNPFRVEKLKKHRRCEKQTISQLFIVYSFFRICYQMESSNLVFLIRRTKLNQKLVLNHF